MNGPRTAIVLLNWNGWQDTVDCITSLLALRDQSFVIVVCDNASTDDSWHQMHAWCTQDPRRGCEIWQPGAEWSGTRPIVLIQTGANLGFAGGCNVGIRFALQQTRCDYIWLLNNDTVADAMSLSRQADCMEQDRTVGLLGSTLVHDDPPQTVQCFGGYGFNFWTARVRPFAFPLDRNQAPTKSQVQPKLRYISGASTFARRAFIEQVGLLNEQYFLYFEEIDWAVRGRNHRMSYCPESVVLHKEGRSIGSASSAHLRSEQSERWLTRNRILFMRTWFPARVPVTVLWVLMIACVRACTGHLSLAMVLLRGTWQGLRAAIVDLPKIAEWPAETPRSAGTSASHRPLRGQEHTA